MKTSTIINILQFPKKKGNGLKPWYGILWSLLIFPFAIVFGIGFYITILLFSLSFYHAEQFRKDYMLTW